MRTSRILISGAVLIAIALLGLYTAIAQPARPANPPKLEAASVVLPTDAGAPYSAASSLPNTTCASCTSDQDCATNHCNMGCLPIVCDLNRHRCFCE